MDIQQTRSWIDHRCATSLQSATPRFGSSIGRGPQSGRAETIMTSPKYTNALIVGAGEGLGASLARLLTKERLRVSLAARDIGKLTSLCSETGARAFSCDATDAAQVERLFADVE